MNRGSPIITALVILGGAASPAFAQQGRPVSAIQPTGKFQADPNTQNAGDPSYRMDQLSTKAWTEDLTRGALANESPGRIKLARQMQVLIEAGQCGPAAQMAYAQHDDEMAARVPDACAKAKAIRAKADHR